jgi:hypothetical protein
MKYELFALRYRRACEGFDTSARTEISYFKGRINSFVTVEKLICSKLPLDMFYRVIPWII